MSEITIPYHLAIPSIICIVGLLTIILLRKKLFTNRRNKIFWISVIVFLSCYAFLVGGATYIDMYYQWDLNRYDLDKDGFFGGQEITKEQEAAMSKLINDTGRNFSFITGLIFSFFISAASYFAGWILVSIKDRVRDERNENHTLQKLYVNCGFRGLRASVFRIGFCGTRTGQHPQIPQLHIVPSVGIHCEKIRLRDKTT